MTPEEQKTTDSVNEKLNSARNKADADHREEARLKVKADKGQASFTDANEYARVVGKQYGDAIRNLSGSELPNGQMGDTIANETLKPFLTEMTDTVKNYATDVMETAMKNAGIGLKPIVPYEADKVDGILKAAVKDKWDDIKDEVGDAAGTLAHKCVDDSIKANARFQYNAGMSPKIIRTATPGACKWCEDVAGEYEYQEVRGSGNDVFRRHANCDCIVEYVPRKGGKQVVSSSTYHQNRNSLTPEEREKRAEDALHRKEKNQGKFAELKEPMQLRHVRRVMQNMNVDYSGAKIVIERGEEWIGSGYYGMTTNNGKEVRLFPDAFKDRESLVKTIGHENVHLRQIREEGPANSNVIVSAREHEARSDEQRIWEEYLKRTGYHE